MHAAGNPAGTTTAPDRLRRKTSEPVWVRWLLTSVALVFLGLFLFVPLVAVFVNAFSEGATAYWAAIRDPETLGAVKLTLLTAGIAVPLNILFGVSTTLPFPSFHK